MDDGPLVTNLKLFDCFFPLFTVIGGCSSHVRARGLSHIDLYKSGIVPFWHLFKVIAYRSGVPGAAFLTLGAVKKVREPVSFCGCTTNFFKKSPLMCSYQKTPPRILHCPYSFTGRSGGLGYCLSPLVGLGRGVGGLKKWSFQRATAVADNSAGEVVLQGEQLV